jgi:hypothetical protein
MARSRAIAILLALTGALLWGCSHPTDNEGPPDLPYPLRSSPDSLMVQFVWAYNNMDLDVYLDCFAEDFVFWLNPLEVADNPEYLPGYWGKAVEETIHAGMFGGAEPSADRIELTISLVGAPTAIEPTPGDIHWQYEESVDLRVYIGATVYVATAPSLFEIHVDQGQEGPNGETLWEIVGWYDLEPAQRGSGRESRSWGSVKALFR